MLLKCESEMKWSYILHVTSVIFSYIFRYKWGLCCFHKGTISTIPEQSFKFYLAVIKSSATIQRSTRNIPLLFFSLVSLHIFTFKTHLLCIHIYNSFVLLE